MKSLKTLIIGLMLTALSFGQSLTGVAPANFYGDLLHLSNSNVGITSTLQNVYDGKGGLTALQLSTLGVYSSGFISANVLQINGTDINTSGTLTNVAYKDMIEKVFGIDSLSGLIVPHPSLPNNYAIRDANGNYQWMVEIPRKNWDPTNLFASSTIHPAFIVNGVQRRLFIGKFEVSKNAAGQYVTVRGAKPAQTISFDNADAAANALNNGTTITGFHLMTNAEWALIALISKYLNTMPNGNNNYGRDIDDKFVTGVLESGYEANFGSTSPARWLTGSGGNKTSHDGTAAGIFDLNGNVWEWVRGMRINLGEIQILVNNNAADYTKDVSSGSAEWKAILQDGSFVAPGTASTLKYDGHTVNTASTTAANGTFETLTAAGGVTIPDVLKSLGLFPYTTGLNGDYKWLNITSERVPIRGGFWNVGTNAGVFALSLSNLRSGVGNGIGFRLAFVL